MNSTPHTRKWRSEWKARDPEGYKIMRHREYILYKDRQRENALKKAYGITLIEYRDLYEKQGGVCAICSQTCNAFTKLSVDHCHKTGKIRGLLCANCNSALGKFKDSVEIMQIAIDYLSGRHTTLNISIDPLLSKVS